MEDYTCTYFKSACCNIIEGKKKLKEIGFQEHCLWCIHYKKDKEKQFKKAYNKSLNLT